MLLFVKHLGFNHAQSNTKIALTDEPWHHEV